MYKLAPSLLAADFARLGDEVKKIDELGIDYVHIDVMDGTFVPSLSIGFPTIKSIRKYTNKIFDVHLMINEPIRYINEFVDVGADIITIQAESCIHLNRTIMAIKEKGVKVGVAINPSTPLNVLEYILEEIDMVLIMSVNPGFGGQKFIKNSLNKISDLRKLIDQKGLLVDIEVDGGINLKNAKEALESGANILVAGTAIFEGDTEQNIIGFKNIFKSMKGC